MNHVQKMKLQDIAETLRSTSNFGGTIGPVSLVMYWKNAVMYNRIQASFLKHGEGEEVVRVFNCKDTGINEVVRVNVKAKKNYTRLQWFTLLVACDYYFFTCQQMKETINKF